jgi:hypothetical protein
VKKIIDEILKELEEFREVVNERKDFPPTDWQIRVCEAVVARKNGYDDRWSWRHLQGKEEEK